jgi:hypothetical protein
MQKASSKTKIRIKDTEKNLVGRNPDGTFAIGNSISRNKPLNVGDFLDAIDYVGNEKGVPLLVQAIRMAYEDPKLMGKVLDKFVENAGSDDLDKKQAIQVIIQNYLGSPGDIEIFKGTVPIPDSFLEVKNMGVQGVEQG